MSESRETLTRLRAEVAEDLARDGRRHLDLRDRRELARQFALARLRRLASERVADGEPLDDPVREQGLAQAVLDSLFGLGRLQHLVDDERIENIDVNGCDEVWVTYADGTKAKGKPVADSDEELIEIVRSAATRFGLTERRFDTAHPELDLRLPGGGRLSALMSVTRRPSISIRRHRLVDLSLEDLVALGTLDQGTADLLGAAVRSRKNIVVAGAMNTGKTTLVRALASAIPPRERLVTIEQAFELGLGEMPERHPDLVALEAREANTEGEGEITMARLVRRALRMNADRVIVGEVLGDEIIPMLNAMSQGRSGSMCTIHADSSEGVFRRIASYAVQSPQRLPLEATNLLIAGAIHFIVFLDVADASREQDASLGVLGSLAKEDDERRGQTRFTPNHLRRRVVSSVREVVGADGIHVVSNEVLRPSTHRRAIPGAPLQTATLDELVKYGFDPASLYERGALR